MHAKINHPDGTVIDIEGDAAEIARFSRLIRSEGPASSTEAVSAPATKRKSKSTSPTVNNRRSEGMKAYWAARKKAEGAAPKKAKKATKK